MNINAIIAQLDLQTSWFLNALENISDEESGIKYANNLNPIKWVAGHLTDARMTIFSLVSDKPSNELYKRLFGKGASNIIDKTYPTIETVITDWLSISVDLKHILKKSSEKKLLSKPPFQASIPDETLLGLVAYFVIHESFHIGQISVLRKLIGKQTMAMVRH